MTVAGLSLGWLALALLVSPPGARALWKLRPVAQATVLFGALLGLVLVPLAATIVALSRGLETIGFDGSTFSRCGKLIAAIVAQPLERPDLTAALALLTASIVGLVGGIRSAWRSQARSRTFARRVEGLWTVVPSQEPFAFTAGFLRPKVVVSEGFIRSVPSDWKRIVLAHEEAHRRGRHPLFLFLAEAAAKGMPLLPLRWAANAFRLSLEAIADEGASRAVGDRGAVAEAVAGLALASVAAVGFEGGEVLRVRKLLERPTPVRAFATSVLVAAVLMVVGFAGGHAIHCGESSIQALRVEQCRMP